MKKKLSCGLLALTMAFNSAPALLNGSFNPIGAVDAFAAEQVSSVALGDVTVTNLDDAIEAGKISSYAGYTLNFEIRSEHEWSGGSSSNSPMEAVTISDSDSDSAFSGIKLLVGATYRVCVFDCDHDENGETYGGTSWYIGEYTVSEESYPDGLALTLTKGMVVSIDFDDDSYSHNIHESEDDVITEDSDYYDTDSVISMLENGTEISKYVDGDATVYTDEFPADIDIGWEYDDSEGNPEDYDSTKVGVYVFKATISGSSIGSDIPFALNDDYFFTINISTKIDTPTGAVSVADNTDSTLNTIEVSYTPDVADETDTSTLTMEYAISTDASAEDSDLDWKDTGIIAYTESGKYYGFVRWSEDSNNAQHVPSDLIVSESTVNVTYVSSETGIYTIKFDANYEGSSYSQDDLITADKTLSTLPSAPTQEGYKFLGWDTDKTATTGTTIDTDTVFDADSTYYAVWEKITEETTYTIKFDANYTGATYTQADLTTGTDGKLTTAPSAPTQDGYKFLGWDTDKTSTTGATIDTDTVFYADSTYYAVWEKITEETTYTIKFDANYTGATYTQADLTTGTDGKLNTAPSAPTQEGYKFLGWSTDKTSTTGTTIDTSTTFSADATYYAVWEEDVATDNEYVITFDYDGATSGNTLTSGTTGAGDKLTSLPTPTKDSNKFVEWNTQSDGSGDTVDADYVFTSSVTIYAVWEEVFTATDALAELTGNDDITNETISDKLSNGDLSAVGGIEIDLKSETTGDFASVETITLTATDNVLEVAIETAEVELSFTAETTSEVAFFTELLTGAIAIVEDDTASATEDVASSVITFTATNSTTTKTPEMELTFTIPSATSADTLFAYVEKNTSGKWVRKGTPAKAGGSITVAGASATMIGGNIISFENVATISDAAVTISGTLPIGTEFSIAEMAPVTAMTIVSESTGNGADLTGLKLTFTPSGDDVNLAGDYTVTGTVGASGLTIYDSDKLYVGVEYTVSIEDGDGDLSSYTIVLDESQTTTIKYETATDTVSISVRATTEISTPDVTVNSETKIYYGYSAADVEAAVSVKVGDKTLIKGTDYTISVGDNLAVGTQTDAITIKGIGDYSGEVKASFTVDKAGLYVSDRTISTTADTKSAFESSLAGREIYAKSGNISFLLDIDWVYDASNTLGTVGEDGETTYSIGDVVTFTGTINNVFDNYYMYNINDDDKNATTTITATITVVDESYFDDNNDDDYYTGSTSDSTTTVTGATIVVPTGVTTATVTPTTAETISALAKARASTSTASYTIASTPLTTFSLNNFPSTSSSVTIPVTLSNTSYNDVFVVQYDNDGTWKATYGPLAVTNGTFNLTLSEFSTFHVFGATVSTTSGGSSSSSGSSFSSAVYYNSGSVRVNGSYITELRNVLVGELVNLSKITTVNGQEVLGWYYDSAMTNAVSNTSQFVITSDVISNGLYAKTSGTTVVPDSYSDGSTNAGNGSVTSDSNTYVPSVVPSTVAKLLSKLF